MTIRKRPAIFSALNLALVASVLLCPAWVEAAANNPSEAQLLDPTQPNWFGVKTSKKKRPPSLILNSLVTGPTRRLAVINGDLLREGETKNGVTVKQILDDRVLITGKDGKKKILKLKQFDRLKKIPTSGTKQ